MRARRAGPLLLGVTFLASGTAVAASPGAPRLETPDIDVHTDVDEPPRSDFHLQLEASTEFPVFVGGALALELPGRVEIGGGVGAVPGAYLGAAGGVATSIAGMSDVEAELVESALSGGWAARAFIGWRPFSSNGLYLRFGYQALMLGAELSSADAIAVVTGVETVPDMQGSLRLDSTLHMLYGEIGYRWNLDPMWIRLALGFTGALSSRSEIDVPSVQNQALADELAAAGEAYIDDTLRQYLLTPTVGLAVGFDLAL